jgi:small-conductance mechanosensitive channel
VIAVGGVTGLVQRIGIRASVIRLPDNSELIVPNGQLISEKVTNRTLPSRQARIDLRVGVAYDSDPQRVIELLTKVAAAHPLVASQPPAEAFMKEFGADALMFDLVFWTDVPVRAPRVHSDVAGRGKHRVARRENHDPVPAAQSALAEHRAVRCRCTSAAGDHGSAAGFPQRLGAQARSPCHARGRRALPA